VNFYRKPQMIFDPFIVLTISRKEPYCKRFSILEIKKIANKRIIILLQGRLNIK